jgi:hypothetical protein
MIPQTDSSQLANCDHIPVIDLSSIDSASLEERQKLAQTIFEACTQVGFFYIKVPFLSPSQVTYPGANMLLMLLESWYFRFPGERNP